MTQETFRPRRPSDDDDKNQTDRFDQIEAMRAAAADDHEENHTNELPQSTAAFQMKGLENAPPAFLQAMQAAKSGGATPQPKHGLGGLSRSQEPKKFKETKQQQVIESDGQLKEMLEGLKGSTTLYDEIQLPSKGRFYDGVNGPSDGILHIRPMTGEEEQILATPRFVRKGHAINMIFAKCLKEKYKPESLLTIDRTFLLIYLRGISYSPDYDVEVKCPECEKKFSTSINLELNVESCPDDYGPILEDVLPKSGYRFAYRLSVGRDEQEIQEYRDRRIKAFGDNAADDTLTYRTAQLVEHIEGLTDKRDLQTLIKNLPISDVSHIRGCINEPPFGVDTNIDINCPSCLHEFQVELPLEANFFFPRRKKDKIQA
jgi:hypothetical protein